MSAVEVTLTDEGTPTEYQGARSYESRTIRIGRTFEVRVDGELAGRTVYRMFTRERRGKGMRYVYARWQSPGWEYISGGGGRGFEAFSKKDAIERIVREWERREVQL